MDSRATDMLRLREQMTHLFPAATLEVTVRSLVAAREWAMCRRLYDQLLYRGMMLDNITVDDAVTLGIANARLVAHLWPKSIYGGLSGALLAVTNYGGEYRPSKQSLEQLAAHVAHLTAPWGGMAEPSAEADAVQTVVSVVQAAVRSRSFSNLSSRITRGLVWAESAQVYAARSLPSVGRREAEIAARTEVWRAAFQYLEMAFSVSTPRERV